mgnify:CR=1 FL=1
MSFSGNTHKASLYRETKTIIPFEGRTLKVSTTISMSGYSPNEIDDEKLVKKKLIEIYTKMLEAII